MVDLLKQIGGHRFKSCPAVTLSSAIAPTLFRQSRNISASSLEPSFLIRWLIQEIRRIAIELAQRRIPSSHTLAWSLWRRAHQVLGRHAHLNRIMQLLC